MIKEEVVEKLREIDKKLFDIFSEVTSVNELSVYKSSLLTAKLGLLEIDMNNSINSFNSLKIKEDKILYMKMLFVLILYLIFCISIIFVPIVGLVGIFFCSRKCSKYVEENKENSKMVRDLNEFVKRMWITYDNCDRFVEAKTNPEILGYEDEDLSIEKDNVVEIFEPICEDSIKENLNNKIQQNYTLSRRKTKNNTKIKKKR